MGSYTNENNRSSRNNTMPGDKKKPFYLSYRLLQEMGIQWFCPNVHAYNAVMDACRRLRRGKKAFRYQVSIIIIFLPMLEKN